MGASSGLGGTGTEKEGIVVRFCKVGVYEDIRGTRALYLGDTANTRSIR